RFTMRSASPPIGCASAAGTATSNANPAGFLTIQCPDAPEAQAQQEKRPAAQVPKVQRVNPTPHQKSKRCEPNSTRFKSKRSTQQHQIKSQRAETQQRTRIKFQRMKPTPTPEVQNRLKPNSTRIKSQDVNPQHQIKSKRAEPNQHQIKSNDRHWPPDDAAVGPAGRRCSHLHRDRQTAAALVAGNSQPLSPSRLKSLRLVQMYRSRETLFVKEICIGCGPDRICTRRFRPAFFGLLASTSIAVFVIVSLVLATLVKRRRLQAKHSPDPLRPSRQLSSSAAMRLLRTARPQSRELLSKFFVQIASTRDRQICGRMTRKRVKKLGSSVCPYRSPY
uniref:LRRCT domain-containing protein n=1 Tax=Macrostomum lignano TaxID=282301 RepID=A0A1I8FH81_9PLAT